MLISILQTATERNGNELLICNCHTLNNVAILYNNHRIGPDFPTRLNFSPSDHSTADYSEVTLHVSVAPLKQALFCADDGGII